MVVFQLAAAGSGEMLLSDYMQRVLAESGMIPGAQGQKRR